MGRASKDIKLTSFEEIFGVEEEAVYKVQIISILDLKSYHRHPFRVLDDEKMNETVESIKRYGVLVPAIARPLKDGTYELIAGHRRKRGCELAGLLDMPVNIRELDDDEADIIMVDSNIQREDLLISEKAFAYKIKFEALKHQGKKAGASDGVTTEKIGEKSGESGRTIQRYIRLTQLKQELLDMVDNLKIKLQPAEKLSYLKDEEQDWLFTYICTTNTFPGSGQAEQLKQYSKQGKLTKEMIGEIMAGKESNTKKFEIPVKKIKQYFPEDYSMKEMEHVIFQLLEDWKKVMQEG